MKLRTIVLALIAAVAMSLLGPAGHGASAASAAGSNGSPATQPGDITAREAASTFRCGRWRPITYRNKVVSEYRSCANLTKTNRRFSQDAATEFFNESYRQTVPFTCGFSKEKTWSFTAEASTEIEAGVIFAKAAVTLTASIQRTLSAADTADTTLQVAPRRYARCVRGAMLYDLVGFRTRPAHDQGRSQGGGPGDPEALLRDRALLHDLPRRAGPALRRALRPSGRPGSP